MDMDKTTELIISAQNGDKDAKEQLVKENSGLVWSIVSKFRNRGHDSEDLFQIGAIGLIKCIDKFDLNFNVRFSTYAVPMIMGEIKRFLRDDGMIKVSRNLKEISIKAKYTTDTLTKKMGKSPTINEIAKELDISSEELVAALDAGKEVESLYSTVYQGDGNPIYLIDKLDLKEDSNEKIINNILLKKLIDDLPEREKKIIRLRYFSDKTQIEVAKEIGVSQVQISRIEKKLLKKFKDSFTDCL